jgi:hypothetical protein
MIAHLCIVRISHKKNKKMKLIKLIIITLALSFGGILQAQVSMNINVGSPPMWGPAGYSNVQYYYLPDVYSYYDVPSSQFIYYDRGKWVRRAHLPNKYRNYDLYSGYKVVLTDYRGNSPYAHYKQHKVKYAKGYRGKHQDNIGANPGHGNKSHNMKATGKSVKQSKHVKQSSGKVKSSQGNKGNKGSKGKK